MRSKSLVDAIITSPQDMLAPTTRQVWNFCGIDADLFARLYEEILSADLTSQMTFVLYHCTPAMTIHAPVGRLISDLQK
jgi:hypothetical protein